MLTPGEQPAAFETLRIKDGFLRWNSVELRVSYDLSISETGEIEIRFDGLHRSRCDKPIHEVIHRLYRGENRLVPDFHLSGKSESDIQIRTECARLTHISEKFTPYEAHVLGTAAELTLDDDTSSRGAPQPADTVVYLSRAQRGFSVVAAESAIGRVSAGGPHANANYEERFGLVRIERQATQVDGDWVEACDGLAEWTLQLLSLGQGRWLDWTVRAIYASNLRLSRTIRPQSVNRMALAALFHHLNLAPVLKWIAETYETASSKAQGVRVALSWMLAPAASVENGYLNFLIALEHLLWVFDSNKHGVMDRSKFKSAVRTPLLRVLGEISQGVELPAEASAIFRKRISELNAPTFYEKLLQMVDHYSVPIADIGDELRFALVQCRNDVVHRGVFHRIGDDPEAIYRASHIAEEFLKRVIMAMLGYKGQYISSLYNLESYVFGEGEVRSLK